MAEVEIQGLAELRKALKDLEGKVPKELASGFKAIAMRVADKVRSMMPPKLQKTVKGSGTQKGGSIKYTSLKTVGPWNGNKNVTGWWDFGGIIGRQQSDVHPAVKGGRFVYPTIREEKPTTLAMVDDLIRDLAARAGFEQKGHVNG